MTIEEPYQHFLANNLYPRHLKSLEPVQGFSTLYLHSHGKKIINFSASDYLGLANHPVLIAASQAYAARFGVGAGASRLVTGNFSYYETIENKLAAALQKPAALILGAGFQTNQSVLNALLDPSILGHEPLVLCDKFSHASIISTIRHVANMHRFKHNDLAHLKKLLQRHAKPGKKIFIIIESVYSMEGDVADLAGFIQLATEYQAFLYVDDAHAVGVYGKTGWGMATDFAADIPLIMGTFSKALGSFGGYVACSTMLKDYLVNKCQGFIYSTAPSPAVMGAIDAVIDLMPTLDASRVRVKKHAERVRAFFRAENLSYGHSETHIVPWIIGEAKLALHVSALLVEKGILATAIQPPSVPVGKSRIRFCLSTGHSDEDVDYLLDGVRDICRLLKKVRA